MKNQRLRLLVLCEDPLHRALVEQLAERWRIGPRQRTLRVAPDARGSAAQFVLDHFVDFVRFWRSLRHDGNVGALVMIDGDEKGIQVRRRQLAARLKEAGEQALDPDDPRFVIVVPCWHVETWVAWLCGHRPIDEQTCYKPEKAVDPEGREVGRRIKSGEYSARRAVQAWVPPAGDEGQHVPSLTYARHELRRLGVSA